MQPNVYPDYRSSKRAGAGQNAALGTWSPNTPHSPRSAAPPLPESHRGLPHTVSMPQWPRAAYPTRNHRFPGGGGGGIAWRIAAAAWNVTRSASTSDRSTPAQASADRPAVVNRTVAPSNDDHSYRVCRRRDYLAASRRCLSDHIGGSAPPPSRDHASTSSLPKSISSKRPPLRVG